MNKSITIIDYRYSDRRCYQAALSLNEGLLSFLLPCSGVCPPCAPEDRVSRVTHLGHESREKKCYFNSIEGSNDLGDLEIPSLCAPSF